MFGEPRTANETTRARWKQSRCRNVYIGSNGTLGQRFEDWLEMFDLYIVANKTADEKKKAIFLLKIGEELLTVYRSKRKADKSDTYDEIRKMLVDHVKPNTVVFTEVMVF